MKGKPVMKVDELTPLQQKAILALVSQPTIGRASQETGIAERTIYNWMKQPAFQRGYREARRNSFSQAIGLCQRATPVAINVLAKIMSDGSAPFNSRVAAAIAVLKFGRESLEIDDLAARVEALEEQVGQDITDEVPPGAKHVVNVDAKGINETPDDEITPENKGETDVELNPEDDDFPDIKVVGGSGGDPNSDA